MTDPNSARPTFNAEWHAHQAEHLTQLAQSASIAGWWRRGRRRDLLAAAQVHATLGAAAMPAVDYAEQLATAEAKIETHEVAWGSLHRKMRAVEDALRGYGQDLLADGSTPAEAVERLMARVFNDEGDGPAPSGGRVVRMVRQDGEQP